MAITCALAAASCSSAAPSSPTPAPPPPATARAASTSTSTAPAPAAASASTAPLSGCPAPVPFSGLRALAREDVDVDDVAVTPDGHLWVTAVDAGRILELDAAGRTLRTIIDPHGPEGLVPIPGGALALAEQRSNRVVRLDPATGATTPIVEVPNRTTNDGVDGIAYDPARSRLLVPDSANGRLLSVALAADGTAAAPAAVLATGLGRPVTAWPESDGSVDVGVENSPGLVRVAAAGGLVTPLVAGGALAQVDEVRGAGGLLYVTDLLLRDVAAVDPGSGAVARLVTGAADPQGLALLADGRLLLVESTSRELALVAPCP